MLYIVLHGSEVVGVMTSAVDAALIAKPIQGQIWLCQPNSCDAKLLQQPVLPAVRLAAVGGQGLDRLWSAWDAPGYGCRLAARSETRGRALLAAA